MKYSSQIYAEALSDVASGHLDQEKENLVVKSFLNLVAKNGDAPKLNKILELAEEMIIQKSGRRKVTIETARPLKESPKLVIKDILKESDVVESKIDPSLIAGIKITINKDLEWDGSLKRKIDKLFS